MLYMVNMVSGSFGRNFKQELYETGDLCAEGHGSLSVSKLETHKWHKPQVRPGL